MIDLYYWPTPNGWKITIMLEECGLPYKIVPVNIGAGEQFDAAFLKISPNNRMPAIVDHDVEGEPISIFESGAILLYLAEKTGKFIPADIRGRVQVLEWMFWQMAGVGPMMGQANHFVRYAPQLTDKDLSYGAERYLNEMHRLFRVADTRLAEVEYLAGDYSIADIATWSWITIVDRIEEYDISEFNNLRRWLDAVGARPAVEKGYQSGRDIAKRTAELSEEAKKNLFGQR